MDLTSEKIATYLVENKQTETAIFINSKASKIYCASYRSGAYGKIFLNFRNNLIMLTKNLPASQAFWKIPFRIGLDAIAAWKGLLTGNSVSFRAISKAHLHYWKWFFTKRQKNRINKISNKNLHGIYHGLVIWDYFIKGRTTFSEIVSNKK